MRGKGPRNNNWRLPCCTYFSLASSCGYCCCRPTKENTAAGKPMWQQLMPEPWTFPSRSLILLFLWIQRRSKRLPIIWRILSCIFSPFFRTLSACLPAFVQFPVRVDDRDWDPAGASRPWRDNARPSKWDPTFPTQPRKPHQWRSAPRGGKRSSET